MQIEEGSLVWCNYIGAICGNRTESSFVTLSSWLTLDQSELEIHLSLLDKLLTWNNPGDPLINLLNPAPQSPAPQKDPQPVQHAPALNESQGQSHIAPAQQPLPDDVTRRLDSLEKLLKTYDGTKDPDDHLHAFYSCMQAQNASDALMCKIFPFILHVLEVSSFNQVVGIAISSFNQVVGIVVVIQGLQHERFRDSLIKHPAATFNEVNDRSLKFITAEEYALSQKPVPPRNQNPDWRDEGQSKK
ncbi:hypothetical protein SLEP1_g14247 [Rubroshorea leprosula]|uniref:Uncharacterized protein n=1 Tax=Rubroshorea leprosula TaxID=152421 RepID=A0AAV5IMV1_9ROSI|nr:hypothetical protein SLEP1_g14247 [Rubroshorea leprosula]